MQEFDNGVIQISPALTVFEKLSKTVTTLGSKLGLSPADREKLASFARIEKEKEDLYEALQAEEDLALRLRKRGYGVWWG